jgi:hypothetical protein
MVLILTTHDEGTRTVIVIELCLLAISEKGVEILIQGLSIRPGLVNSHLTQLRTQGAGFCPPRDLSCHHCIIAVQVADHFQQAIGNI